jgi:hypothetical protein
MLELEERLRRLAGEHERAARVPPAAATVRRGRRRRRRLAGAATTLAVLSLVAGLAGVRELRSPAARELPAAGPAPVTTAASRPEPTADQGGLEPVKGKVVAEGTQPGYRWRLVIRRGKLPDGQYQLVLLLQRSGYQPGDLVTLEPVKLSFLFPSKRDPVITGIVTDHTALVRLRIMRGGAPLAPIQVHPTDGGAVFPHNAWFIAFLPAGTDLYQIELLDRQGRPICSERLRKVELPGGSETIPGGSCF